MIYNIAICDDNPHACKCLSTSIQHLFQLHGQEINLHSYTDPYKLLQSTPLTTYHAFFLDIDMPALNGIMLAKKLMEITQTRELPLIYISSKEEMVYSALQTRPLRFVRKSHFRQEIDEAVTCIISYHNEKSENLFVAESSGKLISLPISQIEYIESIDKIQLIHIQDQMYEIHSRMQMLEEKLRSFGFLRVHKSYLVNYIHIFSIESKNVILDDDSRIPLSKHRIHDIKNEYMRLIQKQNKLYSSCSF
ncbi:LytR/AlgR family response regulator transcription factor [Lactonifactor longoviformis]|uniref:LytR/AlgR family response regulator transcription factor n=1 Tax=Lactonifactor longoviformis TaxID=341220 RepID=UPI001D01EE5F|nr:LytTR family DNA-binding domain-containing protein [Lactonifactor longoviformis]MCB5711665.1 LytTR family DNA-binding domain-containing protein [Lactonifactor longoviformis]MCB5715632.1 LytTR family DNA-binding domain-containing protein [Lactonifactor longoviformis]